MENKDKDFVEFLELLLEMIKKNIEFIKLKKTSDTPGLYWKYEKEMNQIQDLINSFVTWSKN